LLADRSLSRLLKDDWPKSLEELEERKAQRVAPAAVAPQAAAPTSPRNTGGRRKLGNKSRPS
jgi:formamidopyrimidine-DNA glycosylase